MEYLYDLKSFIAINLKVVTKFVRTYFPTLESKHELKPTCSLSLNKSFLLCSCISGRYLKIVCTIDTISLNSSVGRHSFLCSVCS